MRRLLLVLLLSAVLLFAVGVEAPAMPLVPGEAGRIVVFADYDGWYTGFVTGAGYSITDGITVGGYYDAPFSTFGIFAAQSFGPVLVNGEVEFDGGSYWGKVSACYAFTIEPCTLGAGFGTDFGTLGRAPFARIAASSAARDNLHIFGAVDYYYNDDWVAYKGGLAWAF